MRHRVCRVTNQPFIVPEVEADLLERVAAANPFLSEPLPPPTVYPTEVLRQMAPFGNQFFIHRGKSVLSGTPLLSRFRNDSGYRTVTTEEFWSEGVDNRSFGRPYDFNRPFFEQWDELMHRCMLLPLLNDRIENCEFSNGCFNCKSCYLCFDTTESQDCLYCYGCHKGDGNVDCVHIDGCSFCYAGSDLSGCYECQYSRDCTNCSQCFACAGCRGCSDCLGCAGLTQGRYQIFNEQHTEKSYRAFIERHVAGATRAEHRELLQRAQDFLGPHPEGTARQINCEGCTGSYLRHSSNLVHCYNAIGSRDGCYLLGSINSRDCSKGFAYNSELGYCAISSSCYNCHFTYSTSNCQSCWYGYYLFNNSAHCFGCVGLKKNSYCLLNFQYTKAEYEELLPRVVRHMRQTGELGEWFPVKYSTNVYQESWADEYLEEIPESEILRRGYRCGVTQPTAASAEAIDIEHLPEPFDLQELAGRPIRCSVSGQVYSFQSHELEFYSLHSIPPPSQHWRVRVRRLLGERDRMPSLIPE